MRYTMNNAEFLLIGHPLQHSISPAIHKRLFEISGRQGNYRLEDIQPEKFEEMLPKLRKVRGFNVTIPFKQRIMGFLDDISECAVKYGAVNTVKCENGRLTGYNTDAFGFDMALVDSGIELRGDVLLCGSGGVGRMMAVRVLEKNCRLIVATRVFSKANKFKDELLDLYPKADISAQALSYLSGSFDVVLNATPVGMFPDRSGCPVPFAVARSAKAVFDAVYNPAQTVLVKAAKGAGAKAAGGLRMLAWQAARAHYIWDGSEFSKKEIEALCDEMEKLIAKFPRRIRKSGEKEK
jgi:shikimate dehydrogenase